MIGVGDLIGRDYFVTVLLRVMKVLVILSCHVINSRENICLVVLIEKTNLIGRSYLVTV